MQIVQELIKNIKNIADIREFIDTEKLRKT